MYEKPGTVRDREKKEKIFHTALAQINTELTPGWVILHLGSQANCLECPPNSLHCICAGLQGHIQEEGRQINVLSGTEFAPYQATLDGEMKTLLSLWIATHNKQTVVLYIARTVSRSAELYLPYAFSSSVVSTRQLACRSICTSNPSLFPSCTFELWRLGRGTVSVSHWSLQRMLSKGGETSRWLDRRISRGSVCKLLKSCRIKRSV